MRKKTQISATDFAVSFVKGLPVGATIQIQRIVDAANGRYSFEAVRAGLRKIRDNGGPVGGAGTMASPFVKREVSSGAATGEA